MTAYFTASISGKKHYLANYLKIIDLVKSHGHKVISDHIINSSELQVRLESREDRIRFHDKLLGWISSADFIVAETSFLSISVGYEISLAVSCNKPVLILYSEGHAPTLLKHYKDEKLVCEKYTFETLPSLIEDFINFAAGIQDTRFTFFITSKIARYLDEVVRKQKIPKSVYLRKLIEADMNKHNL